MIVDLYLTGISAKDLRREYGVSEVMIYACVKNFTPIPTKDDSTVTANELTKNYQTCV
ncbi:hypothetical protein [Bacillus suaedaesalsae]|uniref:Transposase n=1 Tax=Bacillus suaedaesalsae TaxID=2810349 RepID=A0ABS2DIM7_9BACI|nr:hypothetical protein [Bacillus suaedaesalsae]MBM6618241.1 hypothetical protein [Bacillus suaedaesalsae]